MMMTMERSLSVKRMKMMNMKKRDKNNEEIVIYNKNRFDYY